MSQEGEQEAQPNGGLGCALLTLRITKPDGSYRDVECKADMTEARLVINEQQETP